MTFKASDLPRSDKERLLNAMRQQIGHERYDELLGIHVIGPKATELIGEGGMALRLESTVEDLFQAIHAHPTLSEAMAEAALNLHGRGIHL